MEHIKTKVGSKGELFIPKKIRKKLGMEPGKTILFSVIDDKIQIEVMKDLETLLSSKKMKTKVTLEELKSDRRELSSEAEK